MKVTNERAVEMRVSLTQLLGFELPVKTSLAIASLSHAIDKQVAVFTMTRDALVKNYAIKAERGDTDSSVHFKCTAQGESEDETQELREQSLDSFMTKFGELMSVEGDDIACETIKLPETMSVKPQVIKPLIGFVEIA